MRLLNINLTSSIFLSTTPKIDTIVEGLPHIYLLFFMLFTILFVNAFRQRVVFILLGTLVVLLFLISYQLREFLVGTSMLAIGYPLGYFLSTKKNMLAKNK